MGKKGKRGFDVHINEEFAEEFAEEYAGGAGIDEFARRFAGWQPSATKEFRDFDIKNLLAAIDQTADTFRIIGYNEFPFHGKIEREYWLQLRNVTQRCAPLLPGNALSCMPKPTWHPLQRRRSFVEAANRAA